MPDAAVATEEQLQLLTRLLARALGNLDADAMAPLREHLRWVALAGGQALMAEGERGDSMYLSVSGRLRAYVNQDVARRAWCARWRAARSSAR